MHNIAFRLLLPALLLWLASCAGTPDAPERLEPADQPTEEQIETQAREIPERPLDADTMAQLLEAEFALYRNELERALGIYERLTEATEDPGVARRSAEVAMATGDPFRFLDAALYYRELAPEDDHAFELAVRALARSAEVEGAWALLSEQPEKTRELRLATTEAVRLASQMQDSYQIEWLLQNILETYGEDTRDPEVQLSLAMIYETLGNHMQASAYTSKAYATDPDNKLALRLHINSLLSAGHTAEATEVITQWIEERPDEDETRISLAQMLASVDSQAALPVLEKLVKDYPWSGELLMTAAQLYVLSDTPEKSIEYYERLTQFGEYRAIAYFNLARVKERLGEPQQAAEYYAQVARNDVAEDDADMLFEARLRLGRLYYELDRSRDANEVFDTLRTANPDQSVALYHEEARTLIELGQLNIAIDLVTQGLQDHADSETLLYTRSMAYEKSGQPQRAIADLRSILAMDPENPSALNALGYTLTNHSDNYQEAYDLIERALEISPEDPAIIDSMGWVLYRLGRYEEALDYLQRANDALLDEEIVAHLAEVLWKLDRADEAREVLEQGILELPESTLLPETRVRLGLDS